MKGSFPSTIVWREFGLCDAGFISSIRKNIKSKNSTSSTRIVVCAKKEKARSLIIPISDVRLKRRSLEYSIDGGKSYFNPMVFEADYNIAFEQ